MTTATFSCELTIVVCAECAMHFGMPARLDTDRRRDHVAFYCPAGHPNSYLGKSDIEKAREELAQQKQRREQAEALAAQERAQRESAERRLARTKQRVGGGSCPCCKRHFKALSRHMACKHPSYQGASA